MTINNFIFVIMMIIVIYIYSESNSGVQNLGVYIQGPKYRCRGLER